MTVRFYSSVASEKTLVGTITSGQTTLVVSNTIGLPGLFPYTISLDYETATEELVQVDSAAGTTLTVVRGIDGTSATSHTAGARVRHVSSARDFADSRNHENADDGIHGLSPGEEIVGTDKVQTLSNKTLVDAQGTLLNPDINMTGANIITVTKNPAGTGTSAMLEIVNGSDQQLVIQNDGAPKVRNTVAMDTATTTRRFSTVMSDGTTERFSILTTGMATSSPRTGTAATVGAFKAIDPGDDLSRKMFQLRDSTDTNDRFVVKASGATELFLSNPSADALFIKGPAAMGNNYINVLDNANLPLFMVDNNGRLNAFRNAVIQNAVSPAVDVVTIQGNATQSARLTRWQNSGGSELAYVAADGSANFAAVTASSGIIVPAAGWTVSSQAVVVKAGVATFSLQLVRSGGILTPNSGGDLTTDPPFGTINAAYLPHAAFGVPVMPFPYTNDVGDGIVVMNPSTGDMNLTTYSTGGFINTGSTCRVWMSYPLN